MLNKIGKKIKRCLVLATHGIFLKVEYIQKAGMGRDGEGRKRVDGGQSYTFDILEY